MTTMQPAYTDETLPQLLSLIEGADSVELKVTVAEHAARDGVDALGLDPLEAQIRQVFFFDTPDLALSKQGVVVRARRVQKRRDDSVIKLRPVVPQRAAQGHQAVGRVHRGGRRAAGRLRVLGHDEEHARRRRRARSGRAGSGRCEKLFSKEQRRVYAGYAPADVDA